MGIVKEFKEFAVKGNAVDMAVGIIVGAAFGGVVQSLVKDVIMPPIGKLTGGVDFSDLVVVLSEKTADADAVTLNYGVFINALINFMIVAFAVFMLVKGINTLKRKEEEKPKAPAKPAEDIVLLTEIRDALKKA